MKMLITTLGPKRADELGMVLPHEHVFVDLRRWDQPGYAEADPAGVVALMAPEIEKVKALGVSAIVEASPIGVGRRADILKIVSEATGFPLVVPTGAYQEPWIPPWIHEASEDALCEWMLGELTGEIERSGVRAGWIKLSVGDDGMTPTEAKMLRAAARAGKETGAVIGSHTMRGSIALEELDVVEHSGYAADRFIWIHAHFEPDFGLNLEAARRGAWIEYDTLGAEEFPDRVFVDRIQRMLDAGFGDRILLSHDRGWYDPGQPGGGQPRPYTYMVEEFLPSLRASGVDEGTIVKMTRENPFRAFATLGRRCDSGS
jgi:phosphotriesterase-related protein